MGLVSFYHSWGSCTTINNNYLKFRYRPKKRFTCVFAVINAKAILCNTLVSIVWGSFKFEKICVSIRSLPKWRKAQFLAGIRKSALDILPRQAGDNFKHDSYGKHPRAFLTSIMSRFCLMMWSFPWTGPNRFQFPVHRVFEREVKVWNGLHNGLWTTQVFNSSRL